MNRHAHKIIFNKRLGRMDVVSEIVSSQGKGSQTTGYSNGITTTLIKPLVFALMLTLGMAQILPVQAGTIVADSNAPKTEQPTILNTASGATQVNIQTPTAGGVSMNQYQQFDAPSNGTILNNSRTNANTQTAGWIQGNPWLATGSARVIVNQVNSSNPSLLNGNIEVAGNRAEVIIANPAGIQVNGATFINAARTTLSTGKPIIDNGNLTGYQVNQGQISINGQGLNTQGSDYTDILARSVQINAGIWANQLKVTTGANTVNASNDAVTPGGSSGTSPQFAIDTSALGGMYAGKITLIGTEQGVGVNNAGQIAASAGHVTVDVNGQLRNSGTINANLDNNGAATTQITSQSLNNSGTISSQGNTQIQTGQAINSGTLAAGRELKLNASDINNGTGTINGQRIELNANNLNNTNGKIQQTGTQALVLHSGSLSNANNGLIGYEPISSGTGTGTGTTGNTGTGGSTSTPSTATGGGSSTVVQPAPVALADGAINIRGAVNNDAGQITANGGIDLTSTTGLENHAKLDLRNLTVKGATLDNSSGQLALSGTLNSTTDSLNNQAGKISAQSIQLTQQTTNNAQGSIQAIDTLTLNSSGLLNNQAGTIGANQAVNITAGNVQNSQKGSISSSQSTLNLTSTGVVDNASGTIKANQALTLSGQSVTNDSGLIGSGQNLTLSSPTGALSNQSGQIVAGNELKLNSSELNNQSGRISAAQSRITTGSVNNTSGAIVTQKDAQITSQALDNTSGLIYAGTTLGINTQGQTLTNQNTNSDTQGLVALQNLSVQSGNLNNSSGRIQSNQAVSLNSTDINSAQGAIQGQSLSITANSLNNNQGKVGTKEQASFTLNQNLSNQGGQIWSETGAVTVKAVSLDNSSKGVLSANNADLNVTDLNNQQATVSANTVNIQTADLNNQSGLIESAPQNTINAARLNNADGKITSTGQLDLTTQTSSLAGQLSANGNLNLTAQADMSSSAQISSGALATISAQNLTNQGKINGQAVQLTANNLTNQSGGEISSKQTTQVTTTGTLANQGLMDGKTTLIRSGYIDNSGRIYGDQLAMSGDLNNHDTGVIATRSGTLNLGGNHLTNQNGGLIHSEGDLNIGGSLDANYQTSGSAQVVDNLGSTIESQGNMSIASAQVNNRNIGFSYSTHESIESIPQEYYIRFFKATDPNIATQLYRPQDLGTCKMCQDDNYDSNGLNTTRYEYVLDSDRYPFAMGYARHTYQTADRVIKKPGRDNDDYTVIPLHYDDNDPVWRLFNVAVGDYGALVPRLKEYNDDYKNRTRITRSRDYYSIYINQTKTLESKIDNPGQAAVISSGGAMTFKGSDIFNDNSKIIAGGKLTLENGSAIRNNESYGTRQVELKGTWSGDNIEYDPYRIRYGWNGSGDYSQVVSTEAIKLSNDLVQENLGGYITGTVPTSNNTTTANSSFAGSSASTGSANSQTTQGLTDWVNIRNTTSDSITVPNSSLFTLNPNASGSYVQTDPRFTSYGSWLSSDYMLSALKLDPANLHKRLGDGYYEQKLIRDQVAQLTGRRFLTGYGSDDDQYKALMNAGVTFAGQYNLRPGIALTPEQLARLTSDIVWLVEETVTLPNGSKVQALVPKVYVAVKPGDVTGEGALISADSMDLKLSGNLDNSGTLLGRHLIKMDANNITNSGLIQSNLIDAKAQLDFNNIGGTVNAHTGMNIEAGRDVNVISTTSTASSRAGLSGSTLTQVNRVAGLYVGNGSDSTTSDSAMTSLSVKAGRDVNLTAASIQNDSKNQTAINADGNINLNTVQTQSGVDLVASDVNNSKYLVTNQVGTQINTTGNVQLKAKDSITATAANINSDNGKVILAADKDVNLIAAQDQLNYESNAYSEDHGFLSSSMTRSHQKSQTNTATGSNVTGQQVLIQAGHDTNIVGSNVISDNLTQINAGNDVNILAAQNSQTSEGFSVSKQSGLFAGMSGGVLSIGYANNRSKSEQENQNITQSASSVSSLYGNTTVQAANHLQVTASDLSAGNNLSLLGKSIDLQAAQDNQSGRTQSQTRNSGFSVGITVNPIAVAQQNYQNNPSSGSSVGQVTRTADAVIEGIHSILKPVSFTIGSSKSNDIQNHATSTARVSTLTAGNNLNIVATDGSVNSYGTQMSAEGSATILAKDTINLDVAHNYETQDQNSKASGWSISTQQTGLPFGMYNNKGNGAGYTDTIVGTQLSVGGTTQLATQIGDINIHGSNIASTGDVSLNSGRNISITSAQDLAQNQNHSNNKAIGKVVISDTERFMGYHSEKHNDNNDTITQVSSNVASLKGNVNIHANGNYTQTASNVMAANAVDINAKSIDINTADNVGVAHSDDKSLKIGIFARVQSPLIDLVNNTEAARQSDGRLSQMQTMAAAANAYQAGSAIAAMDGAGYGSGSLAKAEAGIGFAANKNSSNSAYSVAQGSSITGQRVNLSTTEGDIHAVGAHISGTESVKLDSARNIVLEASKNQQSSSTKHSNYGAELGVGASVGAQTGYYIYGQANWGKGQSEQNSTTYNNTHITGNSVSLNSHGDTTLRGADVRANAISTDVGGKLTIESVQDQITQTARETGINGRFQASIGTAWEASGGINQSKANGTYTGVNQQSGLFAGGGGYHVKAQSTELIGGAITSSNASNSELNTGSLSYRDLQNSMNYNASTTSLNASLGSGSGMPNVTPSLPLSGKGNDQSVTRATLTEGNIIIGGQSTSAAATGINTDADQAHRALTNLPDLNQVLADQKAMQSAIGTVTGTMAQVANDQAQYAEHQADQAKKDYLASLTPEQIAEFNAKTPKDQQIDLVTNSQAYAQAFTNMNDWSKGGTYNRALDAVSAVIAGYGGGQGAGQVASNALAPYAASLIGQQFGHGENRNEAAQLLSHAVLGAVLAQVNGGSATAGAVSAAGAEAASNYIAKELYPYAVTPNGDIDASLLTPEQRQNLSSLGAAVGAIGGGLVGNSLYNAAVGSQIGQNAVVNNQEAFPDENGNLVGYTQGFNQDNGFKPVMTGGQTAGALIFSGFVIASPVAAARCLANSACRTAAIAGGTMLDLQMLAQSDVPLPILGKTKTLTKTETELSGVLINLNPATLRWTQTSAGGNGRADSIRNAINQHGYNLPPIDVIQTPLGIVTVDHTRAAVALEKGIASIPAKLHKPTDPLPQSMVITGRFGNATTWGEAAAYRAQRQKPPLPSYGTTTPPRLPPSKSGMSGR